MTLPRASFYTEAAEKDDRQKCLEVHYRTGMSPFPAPLDSSFVHPKNLNVSIMIMNKGRKYDDSGYE